MLPFVTLFSCGDYTDPIIDRPDKFVTAKEPYKTIRLNLIGEEE